MKINKVSIIGISGTGKTHFAKKLSDFLKIPITHYDEFVWGKGWKEVDEKIVEKKLLEIIKKERWILEGFIHPASKARLENSDTVIYLDYSGFQAMLGGLQRWWRHRGKTRPEMADGCIEKLEWDYLKVMWKRSERPEIEEAIKGFEDKITRLKTRKEASDFIAKLTTK
jgi:adenylate kinase family enzyme